MDPFTAIIVNLIIGVVLTVASSLLKQATSPAAQSDQGLSGSYDVGGTVPLSFVVGNLGLAGKLEYENTWGTSGGTPNAYLTQVFSFSDVACSGLVGLFADAEAQTVSGSGHTTQGFPVTGSRAGNLWVEVYDGSQTTASTFLTGKFGADPDRPWLSDMIGRGVFYVTLTALYDRTVWSGFPSYVAVLHGIKLYDPRKDSTAGGSGTQRRATPSTYSYSDNPAVIIYNILIGIHDLSGNWLWGMQDNVDPSRLPYASWAAAMNACDASITLNAGGSEKQFRVGREIKVSEQPVDVITELLVACNGRISEAAGIYSMVVGALGSADGSFTDADVIITETATLDPFPALDQIVNGATATYLEPAQAWASKEAVPYYRSDLETEDDGRRQATDLTLTAVFSGTQAQRILKANVEDGRRFYRHVIVLRPGFGLYQPLDVLSWTSAKNQYSSKSFLVSTTEEGPNGNVVVGLQEIDDSDHGWTPATDEQPFDFAPLTPVRPPTQNLTGWTATAADFIDNAGASRRPGIAVTWDSGQTDVRAVLVSAREKISGNIEWSGEINYEAFPSGGVIPHAFIGNTQYQVQGDYIPYGGRSHAPSSWLDVTTTDIPDVTNVLLASMGQDVRDLLEFGGGSARDMLAAIQQAARGTATEMLSAYDNIQTLTRSLKATQDGVGSAMAVLSASFDEAIIAATGPDSALVEDITSLYVALGGSSTGVNIRYSSSYSAAAGWDSRFGLEAFDNSDGSFHSVGIFGEVKNGAGRLVLVGSQIALSDDSGNLYALFNSSGEVVNGTLRGPGSGNFWNLLTGAFRVSNT